MSREAAYRAVYRMIGEHPPRSAGETEAATENARVWRAVQAALDAVEADPCADIPLAPEPGEYVPTPGEWVRNGGRIPFHLYLHLAGDPVGKPIAVVYHSPELARFVAEAVNHRLRATGWRWEHGVEMVWPDGRRQVDLRDDREDAEAVLTAQAEIEGNVVSSRLVRRLITFGPVEEVQDDERPDNPAA